MHVFESESNSDRQDCKSCERDVSAAATFVALILSTKLPSSLVVDVDVDVDENTAALTLLLFPSNKRRGVR